MREAHQARRAVEQQADGTASALRHQLRLELHELTPTEPFTHAAQQVLVTARRLVAQHAPQDLEARAIRQRVACLRYAAGTVCLVS